MLYMKVQTLFVKGFLLPFTWLLLTFWTTSAQPGQVVSGKITERHARALLSVPQGQIRPTYRHIVHAGLNVRAAEEYIAALNRGEVKPKPKKRKQKTKGFTRNMQIAVNSVNQCVEMITKMGIQATVETDDQDNELRMIIHLPK